MAKDKPRVGSLHISMDEATERRARELAVAKGQTIARVVADALELSQMRYEAEQAALALHRAGQAKRRAS